MSGEALDIRDLYKGIRIPYLHPHLSPPSVLPSLSSSAQASSFSLNRESTPKMSRSEAGGKWMASSVKKKDIKALREAGYLAKEIAHRLPDKG